MSIWFECPECGQEMDLMDIDSLNDENQMMKVVMGNEVRDLGFVFDCPDCAKAVCFDRLEY
jgi:predicted RNA-binding Zn-ribbon protein involved in translation (DUF1610 family)